MTMSLYEAHITEVVFNMITSLTGGINADFFSMSFIFRFSYNEH